MNKKGGAYEIAWRSLFSLFQLFIIMFLAFVVSYFISMIFKGYEDTSLIEAGEVGNVVKSIIFDGDLISESRLVS